MSALLLFCLAWAMVMGLGLMYGLTLILPAIMFLGILWIAREAYDADPQMVDVVRRQFKYRKYYAPKSDMGVEHPQVRDFS